MNLQKIFNFILIFIIPSSLAFSAPSPIILPDDENARMLVNNRILAKVGDKPITVIDVMKKMDMIFYRQFPEYTSSKTARYQFYQATWKDMLQDMIDKELILADAEESKLEVTSGDVRQEMEDIFGPNIISNLDKAGLTMDEAWQLVHDDIVIRRMLLHYVNNKALRNVNPQEIRKAYLKYVEGYVPSNEWVYRVISIRHPNDKQTEELAEKLSEILKEDKTTNPEKLIAQFKAANEGSEVQVNISEEFNHKGQEIAPNYKQILSTLEKCSYSKPVAQKSRNDNKTFYRIFFLKDKTVDAVKPFATVANELKNKLIQEEMAKETEAYLKKLREHFAMKEEYLKEMIPEEFQPFILKMAYFN
jgi:hypothetical protein